MAIIHPTAIIEQGATIGENVEIGPYTHIGAQVKIGAGTTIGSHVSIIGKTTIGSYNEIFSHAALGSIPQDLKFHGEEVELIIGDKNKIREFTMINPGTEGGGSKTVIGDGCLLMSHVHIGHDCIIGNGVIIAGGSQIAGHVEIDNETVIGGMCAILQFVKIGNNVMIGGTSAVVNDIPPYTLADGNRAVIKGLNVNGLRRKYPDRTVINALKHAYKELFESNKPLKETAQELMNDENAEVKKLAHFVLNNTKGIPYNRNINE